MTETQRQEQSSARRAETPFATIEEAIEEIRRGRMVVVCDGEDRENEGDLVMAAQFATPGGGQLHGQGGARADLPGADRASAANGSA